MAIRGTAIAAASNTRRTSFDMVLTPVRCDRGFPLSAAAGAFRATGELRPGAWRFRFRSADSARTAAVHAQVASRTEADWRRDRTGPTARTGPTTAGRLGRLGRPTAGRLDQQTVRRLVGQSTALHSGCGS